MQHRHVDEPYKDTELNKWETKAPLRAPVCEVLEQNNC